MYKNFPGLALMSISCAAMLHPAALTHPVDVNTQMSRRVALVPRPDGVGEMRIGQASADRLGVDQRDVSRAEALQGSDPFVTGQAKRHFERVVAKLRIIPKQPNDTAGYF